MSSQSKATQAVRLTELLLAKVEFAEVKFMSANACLFYALASWDNMSKSVVDGCVIVLNRVCNCTEYAELVLGV